MSFIKKLTIIFSLIFFIFLISGCQDKNYRINFNTNGGSAINAITLDEGEKITLPDDPVKTGYSFSGWYLDSSYSHNFNYEKMPSKNLTLYAKWTINQYTIRFNSNGGTDVALIIANYNTSIIEPSSPLKEGYTFSGWYSDEVCATPYTFDKMPAEDITLYAQWMINSYTITFNSNGGSEVAPITVKYNIAITAPNNPVKIGYSFEGWYRDESLTTVYRFDKMPAEKLTVYAKWTPWNSVSTPSSSLSGIVEKGTSVTLSTTTEGAVIYYTIDGTTPTKNSTLFTGAITINNDMTIKAIAYKDLHNDSAIGTFNFTLSTHSVTYDLQGGGGSLTDSHLYNKGDEVTLLGIGEITKLGYTFAGWTLSPDSPILYQEQDKTVIDTSNLIFYAKWNPIPIEIIEKTLNEGVYGDDYADVIEAIGGSGELTYSISDGMLPSGIELTSSGSLGGTANEFGSFEFTVHVTDEVTNVSTSRNYTITINSIGTVSAPIASTTGIVEKGTTVTLSTPTTGALIYYTLDGCDPSGSSLLYSEPLTINSPVTLKAIALKDGYDDSLVQTFNFTINTHTVTYQLGEDVTGEINDINQYEKGDTISILGIGDITNIGYTFIGWTLSIDSDIVYQENDTITMVNNNITFYAKWEPTPIQISNILLSDGIYGNAYQDFVVAEGGSQNFNYTITEGKLPNGISLSIDGILSGTPSEVGTFDFTVLVIDTINSLTTTVNYLIMIDLAGPVSTPQVTVSGDVERGTTVLLSTDTIGAAIYYTMDGSVPTVHSTLYTGPITINNNMTIKAIACLYGYEDSPVNSFSYTINTHSVIYDLGNGVEGNLIDSNTYAKGDTITILGIGLITKSGYNFAGWALSPDGSTLYQENDSLIMDTTNISLYANWAPKPISLPTKTLIEGTYGLAYHESVFASGGSGSFNYSIIEGNLPSGITLPTLGIFGGIPTEVGTFDFTIQVTDTINTLTTTKSYQIIIGLAGPVSTPEATVTGSVEKGTTITLTTETEGAFIYYTIDGTTPTSSSTLYTGPIIISNNLTIKAIGVKYGYQDSSIQSLTYTIITHTVTYDLGQNVTGTLTDDLTYQNGDTVTILGLGSITKDYYTFRGWGLAPDSSTLYLENDTITMRTSDLTLYAKWEFNASSGFSYSNYNDGIIIDNYVGSDTVIKVPKSIDNYPVLALGSSAFSSPTITAVIFEEGIMLQKIERGAFYQSSITTITIPATVTEIEGSSFYQVPNLTDINVDVNNTVYSSKDGVLFNKDQTMLIQYPQGKRGSYEIPNTVITTAPLSFRGAFQDCIVDTLSFEIGTQIQQLGSYAFIGINAQEVIIPNTIVLIADHVFAYSTVGTITFEAGSQLTTIGEYAFYDSTFSEITIPASVKTIGKVAFWGNHLTQVTFDVGSQIEFMDEMAFYGEANLVVTFTSEIPPTIIPSCFNTDVTIYVPFASVSAYVAAINHPLITVIGY